MGNILKRIGMIKQSLYDLSWFYNFAYITFMKKRTFLNSFLPQLTKKNGIIKYPSIYMIGNIFFKKWCKQNEKTVVGTYGFKPYTRNVNNLKKKNKYYGKICMGN